MPRSPHLPYYRPTPENLNPPQAASAPPRVKQVSWSLFPRIHFERTIHQHAATPSQQWTCGGSGGGQSRVAIAMSEDHCSCTSLPRRRRMQRTRRQRSRLWRYVQADHARSRRRQRILGYQATKGLCGRRRRDGGMHAYYRRRWRLSHNWSMFLC
jgi:hypothetical protein